MLASKNDLTPAYEDRLRALGWFLDREKLCQISLTVERDDFLLQVNSRQPPDHEPQRLRFNASEIESLQASALHRRGTGVVRTGYRPSRLTALQERQVPSRPLSAWLEEARALPYQEVLRLVGRDLDLCRARAFRIDEQPNGLLVRVRIAADGPDIYQVYLLPREDLRARIARAIQQRKSQPAAM